LLPPPSPSSTLFPYTTLFRSIDTTYIDNAAQAHFDALDHLDFGAPCAGRAYFISNGEPMPMRDIVNALLRAMGAPEVRGSIPFRSEEHTSELQSRENLVCRLL